MTGSNPKPIENEKDNNSQQSTGQDDFNEKVTNTLSEHKKRLEGLEATAKIRTHGGMFLVGAGFFGLLCTSYIIMSSKRMSDENKVTGLAMVSMITIILGHIFLSGKIDIHVHLYLPRLSKMFQSKDRGEKDRSDSSSRSLRSSSS